MATYLELKAQADSLLRQAEEARRAEIKVVIEGIRASVAEYGLTPEDVFGSKRAIRRTNTAQTSPSVPKYRNPITGATWSGRGRQPEWIKGKRRERFLIET
ncbi:DNA-binding protein Bv3F [Paraburkholderia kururiensis]|uniref:H-NS histone family protein n=1 Tax=Paraburkholderia kururiensis TaxID=984307 RepID=UPI0039A5A9CA